MPDIDDARRILKDVFGFRGFRRGQKRVISALLNGHSALAVFPTGGGKSLCYQLPALLLDGLTVVVSPLIALMKDQVDFLQAHGIAAARLDSSLDAASARQAHRDLRAGHVKLLYVSPERLANQRFLGELDGQTISLLAIDEAHCISQWGHNFRPDYLRLATVADELRVQRVLGLTATATPQVAQDIAAAFDISSTNVISTSYHRPNLELHATPCRPDERFELLLDRLEAHPAGPTIVYVTLQSTAEVLAEQLRQEGFDAVAYHAGIRDVERHAIQDAFMDSDSQIIVATIAFGMGIDKPDIRYVYHYNLPKGPEHYAQEIGRAGRDGEPARCELFACAADVTILENFVYGDTPSREAIRGLIDEVLDQGEHFSVSVYELSNAHDIRSLVVQTLLAYLELDGVLKPTGAFYAEYQVQPRGSLESLLAACARGHSAMLRRVFDQARRGRVWYTIELENAAAALRRPRSEIAGLLSGLEVAGLAEIKVSGARQGYRLHDDRVDREELVDMLVERFEEREASEVGRIRRMLEFAGTRDCLTDALLAYFGEHLDDECGHCGRCLDGPARTVLAVPGRTLGRHERAFVDELRTEGGTALATPRQLARFLCGISSPATTRARLTRDERFGALANVPFAEMLRFIESRRASALDSGPVPCATGRPPRRR